MFIYLMRSQGNKIKALFTRDILTYNISKKDIFEPLVSIGQGKFLTKI